ncbi:MAG: histidine--tRNA ligase [Bacteriovoracaceae bacterium]
MSTTTLTKNPYRGTRDFFPKEKRIQNYLFSVMKKTAESFGYEPYDGPLLEEVELYKAKSGEELINEQIYSFTDRGERFVAIRPEMTPTLARMVAQVHREVPKPIRWYAIPNLMRYEKPQRGRLREHWQFNCDIFGAPEYLGEIEILNVAAALLRNYGANETHFEILVNDRRVVDGLFKKVLNFEPETSHRLYKIIDKAKKVNAEALDKMVSEVINDQTKKSIFLEYLNLKSFPDLFSLLEKSNLTDELNVMKNFLTKIEGTELFKSVVYDPSIVRGLDYYTGLVFEIFDKHPENRRALCGGGSYANLLQIFKEDPLAGMGFGLGDVTLTDFLQTHNLLPDFTKVDLDVIVSYQTEAGYSRATCLSESLRSFDLKVETLLGVNNFKKVFSTAEKKGVDYVIFLGEEELNKNQVQIKNLKTKEQKIFAISDKDMMKEFLC